MKKMKLYWSRCRKENLIEKGTLNSHSASAGSRSKSPLDRTVLPTTHDFRGEGDVFLYFSLSLSVSLSPRSPVWNSYGNAWSTLLRVTRRALITLWSFSSVGCGESRSSCTRICRIDVRYSWASCVFRMIRGNWTNDVCHQYILCIYLYTAPYVYRCMCDLSKALPSWIVALVSRQKKLCHFVTRTLPRGTIL